MPQIPPVIEKKRARAPSTPIAGRKADRRSGFRAIEGGIFSAAQSVNRDERAAAAALDRRRIAALVRHEMFELGEEKGTQPAFFLSDGLEILAL